MNTPMDDWEVDLKLKKLRKCGEISTSADGRFFGLGCAFCEAIFLQLSVFAEHIQTYHTKEVLTLYADQFLQESVAVHNKESQLLNTSVFEIALDPADIPHLSNKDEIGKAIEDPLSDATKVKRSESCEFEKTEDTEHVVYDDNVALNVKQEPIDRDCKEEYHSTTEYDSMDSDFEWPSTSPHFKANKVNKYSKPCSNEHLMQLIGIYKQYPCLWDVNNKDSRSKIRRTEAQRKLLEEIDEKMNIKMTSRSLFGSISRLRRIYGVEKRNRMAAEELKIPFKPTHEFYNVLQFMDDCIGPFKCETCSECFSSHKKFSLHTRKHDAESYACDMCPKEFDRISFLNRHKAYAHKYKQHECSICSKRFFAMYKCQEHMNSHLNIRNYVCEVCGKDFVTRKSLIQHRKVHTEKKKEFTCTTCGKDFIRSTAYYSHIKLKHES